MAADGGGPMTPGADGGGFEKAPPEMTQKPEGETRVAAEKAREKGEMKRLEAEAAADALLNPPLPNESPVGELPSGDTMRSVEQRLHEAPQTAPIIPQVSEQEGDGKELIPVKEASSQGVQEEATAAGQGEVPLAQVQVAASTAAPDLRVSQPAPTETVPVAPVPTETSAETQMPPTEANPAAGAATEGERGMMPRRPEANPPQPEAEKLQQEIETVLQGNSEYQTEKQALEGEANRRWQEIYAKPEDQKDAAIDALTRSDKKAYEKYVEQHERVHTTEKHAEWDIREKQLHDLEEEIKKLSSGTERTDKERQLHEGRKKLEEDRRKTESASLLANDTNYQDLKRKYRKAENKLIELYKANGKTKEQAEEMVRDLAGKKWEDLSDAEKEAFGKDKDFFNKSYSFDRSIMNGSESYAKNKADLERLEKGIDLDGSKIPPDQIAARTQEYFESRVTDTRQGPGRIRKGFKWFERVIESGFGKLEMEDHRRKAFGHAKNLISKYGWRGLLAQRLLPEQKRETAKNLRKLMGSEMKAYLVRFVSRKLPQFIGLSLLFWFVLPIVIGKGLELTKPFGGNG